jgi:polyphosphate kinase 2
MLLELHERDAARLLEDMAAELGLRLQPGKRGVTALTLADGGPAETWREGYPYAERLGRADYAAAKRSLQIELLKLQRSVKASQRRLAIVFEGRDAAGKGGTIRCFTENLSCRGARVVALDSPTEQERGDWYFRRYIRHLPGPGEIALFDRSWYNRAGVERVMEFCTAEEHAEFFRTCPQIERALVRAGIILVKYWLSISDEEQERRFHDRIDNPLKRWKLSPIDLQSRLKWVEYSKAKDIMFAHTDTPDSPWWEVDTDDKRRARLNCIAHLLSVVPYQARELPKVKLAKRPPSGDYVRPPRDRYHYVPDHAATLTPGS